ncbi:hypothetical protein SSBR45G_33360 [Bradyrhizobium sp. SSBR45G]|nr:hypothetical protein SSBR45G_33360 [Bradyrhizobium sp. SSBR45G]GLH86210.1 hypothetical protein SSBR45R_36700 [Bradyrhizobium sp. SSBR45R]
MRAASDVGDKVASMQPANNKVPASDTASPSLGISISPNARSKSMCPEDRANIKALHPTLA